MRLVYTIPYRWVGTGNKKYLKYGLDDELIGLKVKNESVNYNLLLIYELHGANAKSHAITIPPGAWEYFGNYPNGDFVGMCYRIEYELLKDCIVTDCQDNPLNPKKCMQVLEERYKKCIK